MPAINAGKVLVTGANGYVAVWVVQQYLAQGFAVRGTVRSESKAKHLRSLFKSFGDQFEVVIVEDITKDGAFDEAVKGVDAIAHTASPFHMVAVEPSEVIDPAVKGTCGVLMSAFKHAPSVKRIVITSSCAAVFSLASSEPQIFSEENWNDFSVSEVEAKGRDASNGDKYRASKTLAEQAAWAFWKEHKAEVGWDLTVVNPPYVFGPVLHEVGKPEDLNESARLWYNVVVKGTFDNDSLAEQGFSYVDVRDLALAHVLATTKAEAGGERIIINYGVFKWQDFVSSAHKLYPNLPAGNTSYDPAKAVHAIQFVSDRAHKILGLKITSLEETTKATLEDFKQRGWL